uniref:2-phosphoglycerate kinase n=1 Tax=Noccaea caerulescens TaxID=107243 RepID=A0A1J3HKJ8_NOCCA
MKDREESSSSSRTTTNNPKEEHEPREINIRPFSSVPSSPRNASSKYDFVKVKVWLGDADHYYVLSRFLVCRMLTVTKIPNHVAVKISLELKKLLIDNSLLDVSQADLESSLFMLMERRGYGQEYINRYNMMTKFHHQRVPLIILVCGTACVGKSTIATQLAQRLNLPNVLHTDMVYELLRTATDAPLTSTPVWTREFDSSEELINEFCRECRIVRKGLAGDLKKAMKDGKPIIIEGRHLDPSIYLMNDENKAPSNEAEKSSKETDSSGDLTSDKNPEGGSSNSKETDDESAMKPHSQAEAVIDLSEKVTQCKIDGIDQSAAEAEKKRKSGDGSGKAKSGPEPIVISIVLKMAEFDHKALLEEWISSRTSGDKYTSKEKDRLITNLKTIEDYLCSFNSQGVTVVNISATTFPQTLDWLHNYLLQRIEEGIRSSENETQK